MPRYKLLSNPAYRVGSDGSVWSRWERVNPNEEGRCAGARYRLGRWRILKLSRNRTGYLRAAIFEDGRQRKRMVHLLVLEAFRGPCPEGMLACHRNDEKDDARLANLRWGTPESNWEDRRRNGRDNHARGEEHPHAKLSAQKVRAIRRRAAAGERSALLAKEYGVSYHVVYTVVRRKAWRHVDG